MPEEVNRSCRHPPLAPPLPQRHPVRTFAGRGIVEGVHQVGDVMYEPTSATAPLARDRSSTLTPRPACRPLPPANAPPGSERRTLYPLPDHREPLGNLESRSSSRRIHDADCPRDRASGTRDLRLLPARGVPRLRRAASQARVVAIDRAASRREAHWYGVPRVTLRERHGMGRDDAETGWNPLADTRVRRDRQATGGPCTPNNPPLYGDGGCGEDRRALLYTISETTEALVRIGLPRASARGGQPARNFADLPAVSCLAQDIE